MKNRFKTGVISTSQLDGRRRKPVASKCSQRSPESGAKEVPKSAAVKAREEHRNCRKVKQKWAIFEAD